MANTTPKWVHNAVFYQIFPDRFARRTGVNPGIRFESWNSPPTPHGFKGGDLYGIVDRLDDLQDLGVTALYLTPIFASASNHRYHTYDYLNVDPLLGGNDALRCLLDEAHRRDMRVVLDGVFNHASRGFWQFHHVMECGAASPYRDWFHFDPARLSGKSSFLPYPDPDTVNALEQGQGSLEAVGYGAWWNLPALPKFNVKSRGAREFLLSVAEHWVRFGIDGWRLDVPNEIHDQNFWREFRRRVRAINPETYIVGEVWGNARKWLQGDMWDAVMNYQIAAACLGFFGGSQLDLDVARRPPGLQQVRPLTGKEFASELNRLESLYDRSIVQAQLNLLDSHDMARFLTCVRGNVSALKMAWLLVCTLPGAPCIFYGDEVGLQGGQEPDCRRTFPVDARRWNHSLRTWYRDCIALRQQNPALRAGQRTILHAASHTCISHHRAGNNAAVVGFNTDTTPATITITLPDAPRRRQSWKQTLSATSTSSPDTHQTSPSGHLRVTIPPQSPLILTSSP